ncbi:MAG: ATP-binding protein [Treponema sp.]|nr:ATP-binding protein [Treponema sp.]
MFKSRLSYLQVLAVFFAFALMVLASFLFGFLIERGHLEDEAEAIFAGIESQLKADLKELETMIGIISESINMRLSRGADFEEMKTYISNITEYGNNKNITGFLSVFAYFDIPGQIERNIYSAISPDTDWKALEAMGIINLEERDWFILANEAKGKIAVTQPYVDIVTGEVALAYARSLYDNNGNLIAIVGLNILLDRIYEFSYKWHANSSLTWMIMDENMTIIAFPFAEFIGVPLRDAHATGISSIADELEQTGIISGHRFLSRDGSTKIHNVRRLDNGWYIGVATPIYQYLESLQFMFWFLILLGIILATGLSIILLRLLAGKDKADAEKKMLDKLNMAMEAGNVFMWEMKVNKDDPVNPNNEVIWPDEFRRLLGYKDEKELPNLASSLFKCMHPDDIKWVPGAASRHILDKTGKTPYNVEYRMMKKNGECVYIHTTGKTVRDKEGNPLHTTGTIIDITPMKNLIFEAERQRSEAQTANKAKSDFLSHISHEIRTPMNAILGTAEIELQKNTNSAETEEAFNMVYNSGNLLLNIINDILDLSKIEAGKLEIVSAQYDIPSIIYDTVQLNLLKFESKSVEFDLEIDKDTPLDMLGDELRIKQILNNILSNAFKYTEKGMVKLSVSAEIDEQKPNADFNLIFKISDTGQGMSQEQIDKLFDEYTRFNMDANRTIVGTGLGMHITKRLIDIMNGTISVISDLGKGSVFTVSLPQKRIGTSVCGVELTEKLRSSRYKNMLKLNRAQIVHEYMPYGSVLIVDDVESNLYVAKGLMLPYGLKIETALSGFEAIEKIKSENYFDVIFMDHMMPNMNGLEAAKIIRDLGFNNSIVALTANAVAGSSSLFLSNGFDAFISKPIDIRELNSVLNRFIRDKQQPEVVEAARHIMEQKRIDSGAVQNTHMSHEVLKSIIRDIEKAITVLEDILPKINEQDDIHLNLFVITVHGIKSVLLNIGEKELSADALKLELAWDSGRIEEILSSTPSFIETLKLIIEKLKKNKKEEVNEISNEDMIFLKEKLLEIKTACESLQKKVAKAALGDLRKKSWTGKTNELLDNISALLLHGEFKEIISIIENFN